MRILVTGSRDWPMTPIARGLIAHQLGWRWELGGYPFILVHGACPSGADHIADQWAENMNGGEQGELIQVDRHPVSKAEWNRIGRRAGPLRNKQMVDTLNPDEDVCLAFIRGRSSGASGCARMALDAGVELHVWTTR